MSGPLTRGGGENVPGIPGACATRSFRYLIWGPLILIYLQDSTEDTPDFITPQKHSLLHSTAAFASSDNLKVIVWRRDIGGGLISYHQHSNNICDNIPQLAITFMIIYLSFESLYLMRSSKTKWLFGTNDIHWRPRVKNILCFGLKTDLRILWNAKRFCWTVEMNCLV